MGGRPRTKQIVACLLAAGGTLLALESGARIYAHATHQSRGMTFDPELGWRPLPRVRKLGGGWGVTRPASTNSHGWRDAERTFEKKPGIRRIAAIGDSFTFGTGVDDGERFTDLIQAAGPGLEVINLGVTGYGTDQELRVLEIEGTRYNPDVVLLIAYAGNDLGDIGYDRLYSWPKPLYAVVNGGLELHKPRLTWDIAIRTRSYLAETIFKVFRERDSPVQSGAISPPSNAGELFELLVRRMATVTAMSGSNLLAVLAYPPVPDSASDSHAATMARVFAAAGIPMLDTRDLLRKRSPAPDQAYYLKGGIHWNSAGHAVIAEGVLELLSRH